MLDEVPEIQASFHAKQKAAGQTEGGEVEPDDDDMDDDDDEGDGQESKKDHSQHEKYYAAHIKEDYPNLCSNSFELLIHNRIKCLFWLFIFIFFEVRG